MPLSNPSALQAKITRIGWVGDSTVNRAINHLLGSTPQVIFIIPVAPTIVAHALILVSRNTSYMFPANEARIATQTPDTNSFYVGDAADYDKSANLTGASYVAYCFG